MAEIGDNVDRWAESTDQNREAHMGEMDFRVRTRGATKREYPNDPGSAGSYVPVADISAGTECVFTPEGGGDT